MIKQCVICHSDFKTKASHFEKRKTCSFKCRGDLLKREQSGESHPLYKNGASVKKEYICQSCGQSFISDKAYSTRIPKFCSIQCFGKSIDNGEPKSEKTIIRKSKEYYHWRKAVFQRDNYTCVLCNKRGGTLNADHIKPFALFPELRLDVNNGRTLCVECHGQTPTFGSRATKQRENSVNEAA